MKLEVNGQLIEGNKQPLDREDLRHLENKPIPPLDIEGELAFLAANNMIYSYTPQKGCVMCTIFDAGTRQRLAWGRGFDETRALKQTVTPLMSEETTEQLPPIEPDSAPMPSVPPAPAVPRKIEKLREYVDSDTNIDAVLERKIRLIVQEQLRQILAKLI